MTKIQKDYTIEERSRKGEMIYMAIHEGVNSNSKNNIEFAARGDVCVLCMKKEAVANRADLVSVKNKLKGHLEGKLALKLRQNGYEIVICENHIKELAKEIDERNKTIPKEETKGNKKEENKDAKK